MAGLEKTSHRSVYMRVGKKDTTFIIKYTKNNESFEEIVGKKSKGMTAEKAHVILTQRKEFDLRNSVVVNNKKASLDKLAKQYFEKMKELEADEEGLEFNERKSKTLANIKREESVYRNFWKTWKLRRIPLSSIKEEVLKKFLIQQKAVYSHKSITNAIALAKSIIKHTEYKEEHPFNFQNKTVIQMFKKKINSRKRFLNTNEVRKLMKAAKTELTEQNYLILQVLLLTGARPDTVIHLTVKDIDFNNNKLTFWDFKRKMYYSMSILEISQTFFHLFHF